MQMPKHMTMLVNEFYAEPSLLLWDGKLIFHGNIVDLGFSFCFFGKINTGTITYREAQLIMIISRENMRSRNYDHEYICQLFKGTICFEF